LHYAPFYCEENIWQLARERSSPALSGYAVFISNAGRRVACFEQRRGGDAGLVVWDYHVVWLERGTTSEIWDLDSKLPLPSPALSYLQASFLPVLNEFEPLFRVVDSIEFLTTFASDRRHMLTNGSFQEPPPPWDCIGEGSNLAAFTDVTSTGGPGTVMTLTELRKFASSDRT
jgi:protein N-terminal glutamine amidohydrolase